MKSLPNARLATISNQILLALSQLEGNDETTEKVRLHVRALADIFASGEPVGQSPSQNPTRRHDTPSETPEAKFPPKRYPISEPPASLSSTPPDVRPAGSYARRRSERKAAGWTLKDVKEAAKTSLPTARTYEIRRDLVRPEIRARLDHVYAQFRKG